MSKVFVTGGAGYIGSHTVLALLRDGYEVIVLDNFSNSNRESLNRVSRLAKKEPEVIEGNILDRELVSQIFKNNKNISSVIHFAALKAVGESTIDPLKYYENNVGGSIVLLQEMIRAGVFNLVFSSSCTVYGEPKELPIDESHPIGSVSSPYGRTKSIMESVIEDVSKAYSNFKSAILRYFNPVGADSSGVIGEDPNGIPDNLVPFVCQVALRKLEKIKIYGKDYPTFDGTAIRDYLHVSDLADAHVKSLSYLWQNKNSLICNLGTGKGSSVLEVIKTFENVNNVTIPHEFADRRKGDVTEAWANPRLAEKTLGWRSKYTLEEMLADAWKWNHKNPNGFDTNCI